MAIDARKHGGMASVRITLDLDGEAVPVEIVVSPRGMSMRRIGRRMGLYRDWPWLIPRLSPPPQAPAKYLADPAGMLRKNGNGATK